MASWRWWQITRYLLSSVGIIFYIQKNSKIMPEEATLKLKKQLDVPTFCVDRCFISVIIPQTWRLPTAPLARSSLQWGWLSTAAILKEHFKSKWESQPQNKSAKHLQQHLGLYMKIGDPQMHPRKSTHKWPFERFMLFGRFFSKWAKFAPFLALCVLKPKILSIFSREMNVTTRETSINARPSGHRCAL